MKLKITTPFHDKFNQKRVFWPDEVVVFEDQRAADLIARGLATPVQADAANADGAEEKKVVELGAPEPLKEDKPEETGADNSKTDENPADVKPAENPADAEKEAEDAALKAKEESEKEAAEKIANAKAKLNGKTK